MNRYRRPPYAWEPRREHPFGWRDLLDAAVFLLMFAAIFIGFEIAGVIVKGPHSTGPLQEAQNDE